MAKEYVLLVDLQMEESFQTLGSTVGIFDKRCDLKIVGKPCEGKPHTRFNEGLQGRTFVRSCDLLYNPEVFPTFCTIHHEWVGHFYVKNLIPLLCKLTE